MYRKISFLKLTKQDAVINHQIILECYMYFLCLPVSYYCDSEDVASENFTKHFLHQFYQKEHAMKLIKLQKQQGG